MCPLWALSTLANGGLDWTTKQIGQVIMNASTRLLDIFIVSFVRFLTFSPTYLSFQFLDNGFDEAYPLWAISSAGSGGLDWTTREVGQVWVT